MTKVITNKGTVDYVKTAMLAYYVSAGYVVAIA